MSNSPVLLSVDVEPWTSSAAAGERPMGEGDAGLGKTLEALATLKAKATFFVLGSWAERNRSRVRELAAAGHEVASHGYQHKRAAELGPEAFLDEARRSKSLLEDATGNQVHGYRCPNWGISPATPWALPALKKAGYRYDASINPGGPYPTIGSWRGAIQGWRGLDEGPRGEDFAVFVNGAFSLGPWTFPWGLALALRILPEGLLSGRISKAKDPSLSVHSWEFDPPSPGLIRGLPSMSRAALSWGAGKSLAEKLALLLKGRRAIRFKDSFAGGFR